MSKRGRAEWSTRSGFGNAGGDGESAAASVSEAEEDLMSKEAMKDNASFGLDDNGLPLEETPAQKVARTKAKRDALLKERAAKNSEDKQLLIVEITKGHFIDGVKYTQHDPENPPARAGDFVEVTKKDARALVAAGCAIVHCAA